MDIMYESVVTHVWAVYFFLAVMLFNLYSVNTMKEFMPLAKRLRFMTPIYHLTNAIIMYTGAIVATYNHDLNPTVILMIPASIFLLVIEIKRYKKMRVIKSEQFELQAAFVVYAKKIYTIEIAVLIAVYMISKIF